MRETIDRRVGLVFSRMASLRNELGEAALDRALDDILQALGAAAMREAENGAAKLAARRNAKRSAGDAGSCGRRRIDDGVHEECDG